jgi:hypothetical protein
VKRLDNAFNPYQEWLGIDPSKHSPTYFELFGLAEDVSDLSTINSAADAALSRVRACRPGDKARQWASLLDELDRAKLTLLDGGKRAAYLQQVQSGQLPGQQQQQENTVQPENASQPTEEPYAPVTRPVPYSSRQTQSEPVAQNPSYGQSPQQPTPHPMPSGQPQVPGPLAQAPAPQAPAPHTSVPYGTQPAAPYSPPTYPAADPMAPTAPYPSPAQTPIQQPGAPSYDPHNQVPAGQQPMAPPNQPAAYPSAAGAIDPMAPMAPAAGINPPMVGGPMQTPAAPIPGAPMPGAPMPGAPMPGAPMPGAPMPGAPMPGAPMPGAPMPGAPMPGAPMPGAPMPGAPMPGAPMPGAPMPGAPMQGAPMPAAPMPGAPLAAMPNAMMPGAPTAIPTPGNPAMGIPQSPAMNPMAPAGIAMGTVVGGAIVGGPASPPDPMSPAAEPKTSIAVSSDSSAKSASRKNSSAMNQVVLLGSIAVGVLLLAIFVFFGLQGGGGDPNDPGVAQKPPTTDNTPNRNKKSTDNRRPKKPRNTPNNQTGPNVVPVNIEPNGPSNPTPLPTLPVPGPTDPNMTPVDPIGINPGPNTPGPNTPDPNTPDPNTPDPNTPDPNTPTEPQPIPPDGNQQPTPEEIKQLNEELSKARTALNEGDFATAYGHLDKGDGLAKTEPQMDSVDRLRLLTDYAKGYEEGIVEAIEGFSAGDTIKLRGVAEVIIVEVLPTKLIIRASGRNKTFDREKLPVVLSLAIAESWFDKTGGSKACQAAFLLLHPTASDDDKAQGEILLEEAGQGGIEAAALRLAIEEMPAVAENE